MSELKEEIQAIKRVIVQKLKLAVAHVDKRQIVVLTEALAALNITEGFLK